MPDEYLPLLVFPEKRILQPEKGNGFPPGKQNLSGHGAQVDRLEDRSNIWKKTSHAIRPA